MNGLAHSYYCKLSPGRPPRAVHRPHAGHRRPAAGALSRLRERRRRPAFSVTIVSRRHRASCRSPASRGAHHHRGHRSATEWPKPHRSVSVTLATDLRHLIRAPSPSEPPPRRQRGVARLRFALWPESPAHRHAVGTRKQPPLAWNRRPRRHRASVGPDRFLLPPAWLPRDFGNWPVMLNGRTTPVARSSKPRCHRKPNAP